MRIYEGIIHPISDEVKWLDMQMDRVEPPSYKRQHGRSKVFQRRELDKLAKGKRSFTVKYGICKSIGHYKRSCPTLPCNAKRQKNPRGTYFNLLHYLYFTNSLCLVLSFVNCV